MAMAKPPDGKLLRSAGALGLFADLYAGVTAGALVRSAVRIEVERRTIIDKMTEEAAQEDVLLNLALDAPSVIMAALSGDPQSDEWLREVLAETAETLARKASWVVN